MSRPTILTTLLSLCLLAPAGCAVTSSDNATEEVSESQDDLSTAARSLVGRYSDAHVPFAGIGRIELKANGAYSAQVEAGGRAFCVMFPCLLPESGTWNATKSANGTLRLRLRATGDAARFYVARKANNSLTLTAGAITQTLTALGANACLDDADCSSNEECGPRVCLMWCEVGDPACCGPSTCRPQAPPPPAACCDPATKPPGGIEGVWCCGDGSWIHDFGSGNQALTCGANGGAGQVCGGERCGNVTCAAGDVCCNPLSSICTKPGMVCAF